ncbi:hypothetical protein FM107_19785 [Sphingobacterium sp. JB170]|nr:hypothetical protein FM107_19785 [Sphingobacterium sp. JB170]
MKSDGMETKPYTGSLIIFFLFNFANLYDILSLFLKQTPESY